MSTDIVQKAAGNVISVQLGDITLEQAGIVRLELGPEQVERFERAGNDLLLVLKDGRTITIQNFFVIDEDGQRSDLVLEDAEGVHWWGQYTSPWSDFHFAEIEMEHLPVGVLTAAEGLPAWASVALAVVGGVGLYSLLDDDDSGTREPQPEPNQAPAAPGYTHVIAEDTSIDGRVEGSDGDGDRLTYAKGSDPDNGTVVVNADGTYTYTPDAEYSGSDSFTVIVDDGNGGTTTSTVDITVTPGNDPVLPLDDAYTVDEDGSVALHLLSNDHAPDGGLALASINGVALTGGAQSIAVPNGTVEIAADGGMRFVPEPDYHGSLSFPYGVRDADGDTDTATVDITVTPVNDAVTAVAPPSILDQADVDAGGVSIALDLPNLFQDIDGDALTYTIGGLPAGLAFDPVTGGVTGTIDSSASKGGPDGDGVYTVVLTATDPSGESATHTFAWTVANPPPTANGDAAATDEDTTVSGNVLTGEGVDDVADTDPDGDALQVVTFVVAGDATEYAAGSTALIPGAGSLTLDADGSYTFVPVPDWHGTVPSVTYVIGDGEGGTSTATLDITVDAVNDIGDDSGIITGREQPVTTDVLANDSFEGTPVITQVDDQDIDVGDSVAVADGTVTLNPDGTLTFTPAIGFTGSGSYTYTVSSGGGTEVATVTIQVIEPTTTTGTVDEAGLATGTDPTATSETVTGNLDLQTGWTAEASAGTTTHGTYVVNADGTYSFTLTDATVDGAAVETNSFTYTAVDADGNRVTNTVTITIDDDAPATANDDGDVAEGATLTVAAATGVLFNDASGADGWASGGAVVGVSTGGTGAAAENANVGVVIAGTFGDLTLNADGSYSYVSTSDAITADAQDVFTYTVKDADGDLVTATLTIDVADVTGAPTTTTGTVDEAGLATGTDAAGDSETVTGNLDLQTGWTAEASAGTTTDGTYVVNADGTYSFTLTGATVDGAAAETNSFTYTAVDADGNTVTNTVTVSIGDDAPATVNDGGDVAEGATLTVAAATGVLSNDASGADGWTSGGAVVGVSAGGTGAAAENANVGVVIAGTYGDLTLNADGSYSYVSTSDAITADAQDVFTYTVKDADGDLVTATLTIDVADVTGAPTTTTGTVDEAGLATGTDAAGDSETVTGNLDLQTGWTAEASTGTTTDGTYVVNADGTYSFTLTGATTDGATAETNSFTYTAVDTDGNRVTNTVTITIDDDAPATANDGGDVAEGATLTVAAAAGVLFNDASGADGWASGGAVVGVSAGGTGAAAENANVGVVIAGTYGDLTLNADGSYSYVSTSDAITADAQDVFTYTVKDADGDLVTATLTIDVADVTGAPTTTTGTVDEAGLATGTDPTATSETVTGTLDLQTGWTAQASTGTTTDGTYVVNADGTYSFTLTGATTDGATAETNSFTYTAVDADGNTVTNTVTITIVDDVPTIETSGGALAAVDVDESGLGTPSGWVDFDAVFGVPVYGADGPAASGSLAYTLEVGNSATGLVDTATGNAIQLVLDADTGNLEGRVAGSNELAFTIEVNTDGQVQLTQARAVRHTDANDHDDGIQLPADSVVLRATATDGDGDAAGATVDIGDSFSFRDAGPSIDAPDAGTVDEQFLPTGSEGTPGPVVATGELGVDFGTDGAADVVFTDGAIATETTVGQLLDADLRSGGFALVYEVSLDGHTLTATADGQAVFTVEVTNPTGTTPGYTFTLYRALENIGSADVVSNFLFRAIDRDGDHVDGEFAITVVDDAPVTSRDLTVSEDSTSATVGNTFNTSADGSGNVTISTLAEQGTASVNVDGTITYVPAGNYSGSDTFAYTTTADDGSVVTTTVTVTVDPAADAPDMDGDDSSTGGDVVLPDLTTEEDTSVALGLEAPRVTDGNDQNGGVGDAPERLGLITLTLAGADGAQLTAAIDGASPAVDITYNGTVTILLTDVDHPANLTVPPGTVQMTSAQFEALTLLPPAHSHVNIGVIVQATSYEVDDLGDIAVVDGAPVAPATATGSFTVDVHAVTDTPELVLASPAVPATAGAVTLVTTAADGTTDGKISVAITEDATLDLRGVLVEGFQDIDGTEHYWYSVSGLPMGTVVHFDGGDYTVDGTGSVTMPVAGVAVNTDAPDPAFTITPPRNYSNDLPINATITLHVVDSDDDSTAGPLEETISVDLELRVYAEPDNVSLAAPPATPEATAVAFLGALALADSDASEAITQVRLTGLPTGGGAWVLLDHDGNPIAIPPGGTSTGGGLVLTIGTGAGEYTLEQVKDFTLVPPAHSSLDGDITVYVTTTESADNTGSGGVESTEWTHILPVVVTPVAERVDTDTDGASGLDVTMTIGHDYDNVTGAEDAWFALNIDGGFDLSEGWLNEDGNGAANGGLADGSEETFARVTPYWPDGTTPLDGASFQYTDDGGVVHTLTFIDGGAPVDIPLAFLDTLEFRGPLNFKGEVSIKVEAVTVDHDEDDPDITNTQVSGEAWLNQLILDPVADMVTLKVDARLMTDEDSGVTLNIRPSSSDPSEAFDITIRGIPEGGQIVYDGVTYTTAPGGGLVAAGDGTFSLTITDYDSDMPPTLVPPVDSSAAFELTVEAVSVDGDSTSAVASLPIDITVLGLPDAPVLAVDNGNTYVEATLDGNGHVVALQDLITTLQSGETSGDGSETITLRISGLGDGFSVVGAGAVVGTSATPEGRVWVVTQAQIDEGTVQIRVPANYSGTVEFSAQPVITENDNPSKVFSDPLNVSFEITPSPEAMLNITSSIAEDVIGQVDFSPAYQNGDTDETISAVRFRVVDGGPDVTFYADAAGTTPLVADAGGWYTITGVDDVGSIHAKGPANFSGHVQLDVEYKVGDTAQAGTSGTIETDWQVASHDLVFHAVTDAVDVDVASIVAGTGGDVNGLSVSLTEPGEVTVNIDIVKVPDANAGGAADNDGSEVSTHIVIQGVPDGVAVKGATFTGDGSWLIADGEAFDGTLVFEVDGAAGNVVDAPITIIAYTRDLGAGTDTASGVVESDEVVWNLSTSFGDGGTGVLPTVSLLEMDALQTEDLAFALSEVVSGTFDFSGSNQSSYNLTVTLRTSPDDGTTFSHPDMVRVEVVENGEPVVLWTMTVPGLNDATTQEALQNALDAIQVHAPPHANSNNLGGPLPLDVTVTLYNPGLRTESQIEPQVDIEPVTDAGSVDIVADPVAEGSPVAIDITVSNGADETDDWTVIDGKLYLQLGNGLDGVLMQGGTALATEAVSGIDGLADGQYYVIEGVQPDVAVALTFEPDGEHDSGSIQIDAWALNRETGSVVEVSTGTSMLTVEPANTVPTVTFGASGVEHDGVDLTRAEVVLLSGDVLADPDETLSAAFIEGLPADFTVYCGTSAATAGMAGNAGGGTWSIPVSGNALPAYIAIQPPAHWSGSLSDLKLFLVSGETGSEPTAWEVDLPLTVGPKADGVELSPTLTFGAEGSRIALNLNASLKDPVAANGTDAHSEGATLELTGFPDGELVSFYVGDVQLGADRVSYSENGGAGTYSIEGLTQQELDGLGFMHAGTGGDQTIQVRAWTQEYDADGNSVGAPSATVDDTLVINVSGQLPTVGDDMLLWTGGAIDGRDGHDVVLLREDVFTGEQLQAQLTDIEELDLSTNGPNSIEDLTPEQVREILGDSSEDVLVITGTDEDEVTLSSDWTLVTSGDYDTYTSNDGAELHVSSDINVTLPSAGLFGAGIYAPSSSPLDDLEQSATLVM